MDDLSAYKDELIRGGETSKLEYPALSQPMCSALLFALIQLLSSRGVDPAAVVGHSSGETAAAYYAGFRSRSSASKLESGFLLGCRMFQTSDNQIQIQIHVFHYSTLDATCEVSFAGLICRD